MTTDNVHCSRFRFSCGSMHGIRSRYVSPFSIILAYYFNYEIDCNCFFFFLKKIINHQIYVFERSHRSHSFSIHHGIVVYVCIRPGIASCAFHIARKLIKYTGCEHWNTYLSVFQQWKVKVFQFFVAVSLHKWRSDSCRQSPVKGLRTSSIIQY